MPCAASSAGGPMPDNCRICGVPIAPVARMTSPPGASRADARRAAERRDLDADRAPRRRRRALDVRAGPDLQVGALKGRPQERLGRVPADAGALVDVEVTDAFVVAAVEVVAARQAGFDGGLDEGIEDRPVQALLLDSPFAALAPAARIEPRRGVEGVGAFVEVLVLEEVRQALGPAPAGIGAVAVARAPAVVIARLAAHVDHAVDAARAAEHFAARVAQASAVQAGGRFGRVEPVGARVADAVEIADWDVDPEIIVLAARLDQRGRACPDRRSAGWRAGSRRCRRRRRCSRTWRSVIAFSAHRRPGPETASPGRRTSPRQPARPAGGPSAAS